MTVETFALSDYNFGLVNRPGIAGGPNSYEQDNEQVRPRAIRMVLDHEGEYPSRWAALVSISGKIGCSAHTLNQLWISDFTYVSTWQGMPDLV